MQRLLTALLPILLAWLAACAPEAADDTGGASEAGPLTVYSGRSESLIGPLFERFEEASGGELAVRYGGTAELAATILEEGDGSPADLFLSQDAAALGALSASGRLRALPAEILSAVEPRFRAADGSWVGLSGRARTVVYNPELIDPADLPQSLEEVTAERYAGTFGVAPTNASFQAHMAVYRALAGPERLRELLAGIAANSPAIYPKNSPIVEAVIQGEIEWGLVNHYYLWRALKEEPTAPGRNYFMPSGDAASFINLAGAGALSEDPRADELVAFLLSEEAQLHFAQETFEYPLSAGVAAAGDLPALADLPTPEVDFSQVSAGFEETLLAIQESGLLQ